MFRLLESFSVSSGVSFIIFCLTRNGGQSTEKVKAGATGEDDRATIPLYVDPGPVYLKKKKEKKNHTGDYFHPS